MRWVGIDEAGYGPNLGPLVMTSVTAEMCECTDDRQSCDEASPPNLWVDLAGKVDRAGGDPDLLWVDDSKRILSGGRGRDRLEASCLALIEACSGKLPERPSELLELIHAGSPEEAELTHWQGGAGDGEWPGRDALALLRPRLVYRPFSPESAAWRIVEVRSVVIGPACFNRVLGDAGSKARVHFAAFRSLLECSWERAGDGRPTFVNGDKHGGRHYYLVPLLEVFRDTWIDRGPEGPELSRYSIRQPGRMMTLSLVPRADAGDGLVALASIVSKVVREVWMDAFNAFWTSRVEGLRPTAGYPLDAARFRRAIEPLALAEGLEIRDWWRLK